MTPAASKNVAVLRRGYSVRHRCQLSPEDETLLQHFRPPYEALLRFYTLPRSYAECAEQFHLPVGTVKSRLHRAFRKLDALAGRKSVDGRNARHAVTLQSTPTAVRSLSEASDD
jgi:hypothetical protein